MPELRKPRTRSRTRKSKIIVEKAISVQNEQENLVVEKEVPKSTIENMKSIFWKHKTWFFLLSTFQFSLIVFFTIEGFTGFLIELGVLLLIYLYIILDLFDGARKSSNDPMETQMWDLFNKYQESSGNAMEIVM